MPQAGFNIPNAPVIGQETPSSAKEFERMLASGSSSGGGSRSANALSQLMQLMRLRNMLDQQIRGRTKKERDEYDKRQNMGLAQNDVFRDAEYQQGYRDVQNLSAQKAIDKLGVLKKGVIERHAQARGVDPDALYKVMMGQLDAETRQYHKDVKEGKSFWGEVGTGLGEFWDAVRYAWETDPEKRNQLVKEAAEAEAKRVQTNAYLRDQQLREAEGEGFFERSGGETGGFFANIGRGFGAMLPQIGIQLGARAGGAALGGAIGSAGGPVGAGIGGLAGAVFGGAVPGAAQAQYDFARRVMADPNLTDEEKQAALESGQWKATALGGALGAIPIGARDVYRMAAPRVAQALGRGEAQELAKRAAVQEAERGWLGNIWPNTKWSAGELAAMMTGGVAGQNLIYGGATGQDIPTFEGIEEALAQAAVLAPVMGIASARPRYTRAQVAPWRAEGINKYQQNIRAQIENKNFGGSDTTKLVKAFKAEYSRPDDLTQLLTGFEPEQRNVIRAAYGATPERVVASGGTAVERQLAAQGISPEEAGTQQTSPVQKAASTRSGRIQQVADAFAARADNPEAWEQIRNQSPTIAEHIEKVNANLDKLDARVREFYDQIRKEPTTVRDLDGEIMRWLADAPDNNALRMRRNDIITFLKDLTKGKAGDTTGRNFAYDKISGIEDTLKTIQRYAGKKYDDVEVIRAQAKRNFGWTGEIKGAEDGAGFGTEELGGNVPTGKATDIGTPLEPSSAMEAAAEAIASETPSEPVQPSAGSGEPIESGGPSGTPTSNIREGETPVSIIEPQRVEPDGEGTYGGPDTFLAADPFEVPSSGPRKPISEGGGGEDGAQYQTGDGKESAGADNLTPDQQIYRTESATACVD